MKTDPHPFIDTLTRRGFIGKIIGGIATLIGAALFIPLAAYTILPTLRKIPGEWIDVLNLRKLGMEKPVQVKVVSSLKDGWYRFTSVKSVWAVRRKNSEVVIYSPLCTHLGCGYRWEEEQKVFFCPCHDSVFDINGKVLAGPAPRPLDTLPIKLEGNNILTIYKEFKSGASKKIEI